ncbi:enoyl-CoA hydratase/isomerase family protein, partial [Streptomyces sp. NPDC002454]
MEPQLPYGVTDGVATIVICQPAKRNAMTEEMWQSLPPILDELAADPAVRALVLTGAGGTFCAGADISTLSGHHVRHPQSHQEEHQLQRPERGPFVEHRERGQG